MVGMTALSRSAPLKTYRHTYLQRDAQAYIIGYA